MTTTPVPPTLSDTRDLQSREPARVVAATMSVAVTALNLAVLFGLDLDGDQKAGILAFLDAVAFLVAGELTRRAVWSPRSVAQLSARHRAI